MRTPGTFFCPPLFGAFNSDSVGELNLLKINFPNFAPGLVFTTPPALAPCTAIVASVEQTFQFTPKKAGVINVRVQQPSGPLSGRATILTTAAGETRGLADVSGMCYDSNINGSVLALHHNVQGTKSGLLGAWFAFDAEGNSR